MADKPTPAAQQPSTTTDLAPFGAIQSQMRTSNSSAQDSPFLSTTTKISNALAPMSVPMPMQTNAAPMATEARKPLDISSLMSPPEPTPFDNFGQGALSNTMRQSNASEQRPVGHPPLSPPVSPFSKPTPAVDIRTPVTHGIKDPILYPASETGSSPPQPLFSPNEASLETRRVVDEHVAARPLTLFRDATPPQREHYELALYFQSAVMKKFVENPRGWLRKERELLAADRKLIAGRQAVKLAPILPARRASGTHKAHAVRDGAARVHKKPAAVRTPKQPPRAIRATPSAARGTIRVSLTPEPRVRTVAPNREDKDFASLPDYCPPLDSLPAKGNSLKVDWKGNALDLSKDPNAHLLHADEIALAASLRLDCATYLTSKRRIFIRRLECAKIGKEFRKTDAQQACKIDVNKASKLWTAYDKVNWLDARWMRPFLA